MKIGLGDPYEDVSFLPTKLRAYLDLVQPASSLGVGVAFLLGSLFYFYYYNEPNLIWDNVQNIIYALFTVVFAHGASQALNMSEDADIDAQTEHKKNRPIPSGVVSKEEARAIAWILIVFAVGRAYIVSASFGAFISIAILMGVFYNLEPIRAKKRRIAIPWQSVSRGLLMFPTIWAAYGNAWRVTPWILGIFLLFYVLGFQNTADIADAEVDEKYGMKTFVVMYGVKGVALIATGCMLMMIATLAFAYQYSWIKPELISMYLIIPFCMLMVYYMVTRPYSVSDHTGNHRSYILYYAGMVLSVLIPLVVEVLK